MSDDGLAEVQQILLTNGWFKMLVLAKLELISNSVSGNKGNISFPADLLLLFNSESSEQDFFAGLKICSVACTITRNTDASPGLSQVDGAYPTENKTEV